MCGDYLIEVPPHPARKACWTHFTEVETGVQRGQVHGGGPHSREHRLLTPERGSTGSDLGVGEGMRGRENGREQGGKEEEAAVRVQEGREPAAAPKALHDVGPASRLASKPAPPFMFQPYPIAVLVRLSPCTCRSLHLEGCSLH